MSATDYAIGGEGYWTDQYGVHRWNHEQRAGTYLVVHMLNTMVADFFNFWRCPHVVAVVDDFGTLVPVGEMQ